MTRRTTSRVWRPVATLYIATHYIAQTSLAAMPAFVDDNVYLDQLVIRVAKLLRELRPGERVRMMKELSCAAWEGGLAIESPTPDVDDPEQWAADLVRGSDQGVIRAKRVDEGWPHPNKFECLDEIVSAFRPRHSLD